MKNLRNKIIFLASDSEYQEFKKIAEKYGEKVHGYEYGKEWEYIEFNKENPNIWCLTLTRIFSEGTPQFKGAITLDEFKTLLRNEISNKLKLFPERGACETFALDLLEHLGELCPRNRKFSQSDCVGYKYICWDISNENVWLVQTSTLNNIYPIEDIIDFCRETIVDTRQPTAKKELNKVFLSENYIELESQAQYDEMIRLCDYREIPNSIYGFGDEWKYFGLHCGMTCLTNVTGSKKVVKFIDFLKDFNTYHFFKTNISSNKTINAGYLLNKKIWVNNDRELVYKINKIALSLGFKWASGRKEIPNESEVFFFKFDVGSICRGYAGNPYEKGFKDCPHEEIFPSDIGIKNIPILQINDSSGSMSHIENAQALPVDVKLEIVSNVQKKNRVIAVSLNKIQPIKIDTCKKSKKETTKIIINNNKLNF